MEISLIRHGKSAFKDHHRVTGKEFADWVKHYNDHGVCEEEGYPPETLDKIRSANLILTSDLQRSVESASLLHQNSAAVSMPVFRETELPHPSVKGVKFNPAVWAFSLRCLWFMGYSRECESLFTARWRAQKAAQLLIELAEEHQAIALVGHGVFNRFIADELLKKGWTGKRKTSRKHWHCTTYAFDV
ncbi:histidine phosphatase family protein [Bacillus massiliglaciei]|uniref:histidine phosphatase family protein n=1 Tax=Bacillus massiliglaciei TaxID=1816693 RepID=UPI000A82B6BE|nr:phosphoglycerate mutase family protein [Bacillus massiliglaciei]